MDLASGGTLGYVTDVLVVLLVLGFAVFVLAYMTNVDAHVGALM